MNSIYSLLIQLRHWFTKKSHRFRFTAVLLALLVGALGYTARYVLAQTSGVSLTTKVTFANGSGMMDVGGAWDGTANIGGELFQLTIKNNTSETITDVTPKVTMPDGFEYVAGSASPGTVAQSGQVLTFSNIGSLAAGAATTVQYRLRAVGDVVSGTYDVKSRVSYTDGDSQSQDSLDEFYAIRVAEGFSVITKTPNTQSAPINGEVTWNVTVTNTGLGGLFDVEIVEMSDTDKLTIEEITQIAPDPDSLAALQDGRTYTLPYLAPDETFTLQVKGTVQACGDITNLVSTDDLMGRTYKEYAASVLLDLEVPLITYTAPDITLNYGGATSVSFDVENTGNGTAKAVVLETNLHQLPVEVALPAGSSWSYSGGKFTLEANSGTLKHDDDNEDSGTQKLSFDLAPQDVCADISERTVVWTAQYTNECGDIYRVPTQLSTLFPPQNAPEISISKEVVGGRLVVGQPGSYTIQLDITNPEFVADNIVVTDNVSELLEQELFQSVELGAASVGTASLDNGVITWTIPANELSGDSQETLTIDFVVTDESCQGGKPIVNEAHFTAQTTRECSLEDSAVISLKIASNPSSASPDRKYKIERNTYQTGYSTQNPAPSLDDYITITANYEFSENDSASFTDGMHIDDFAGLGTQQEIIGDVQVALNGSNSWTTVPSDAIINTSGDLQISLDFLAGSSYFGVDNVQNTKFKFRYRTTVSDAALDGNVFRDLTQNGTLILMTELEGGCGPVAFHQNDTYRIQRAEARVAISVPQNIERCVSFPIEVTLNNPSPNGFHVYDSLITIDLGDDYRLDTSINHELTGALVGASVDDTTDPQKPTVTLADPLAAGASGTIKLQVSLKADADISPIPGIKAQINYNDNETQSTLPQEFIDTASGKPAVVRSADIKLSVTPQNISVISERVEWRIYILNTGNGTAVNLKLEELIPAGFELHEADTNTANGFAVSMSGTSPDVASWNLDDIPPGDSRLVKVIADIKPDGGAECSITGSVADITATWGCGDAEFQTVHAASPNFTFPNGALQVLHDTTQSYFELCGEGLVTIIVRNVGRAYVYDVEVSDELVGALQYVGGSTEYSTDGGATWTPSAYNPSESGNTLTWTKDEIGALEKLAPQGADSGINSMRIRFKVESDEELSNEPALPKITASVQGHTACSKGVSSPGAAVSLPAHRPIIDVEKVGRNKTVNPTGSFSKTVYGGAGDEVEWKVTVTNNGVTEAKNVRLKEEFAGSGATSITVVGQGVSTVNETMTDDGVITIDTIPAGETREYIITEELGSTCVNEENTTSITWGCTNNGPTAESLIYYPGNSSDKARLNMLPDLDAAAISHTTTHLPNGRIKGEVKIKNNGGTGEDLEFTIDLTEFSSMVLDESTAAGPTGSNVDLSKSHFATVERNPEGSTAYKFTFEGDSRFRNGEEVTVNYYLIQAGNFDTTANGGALGTDMSGLSPDDIRAFEYPETLDNGLDPELPGPGKVKLSVKLESTCGLEITEESDTGEITPQTPDLDIRVVPPNQVVQTGAQYQLAFRFYVKNERNGLTGTPAENITFSLPEIGSKWDSVTIQGPDGESATGGSGSNLSVNLNNSIPAGGEVEIKVTGTTGTIDPYITPGGDVGLLLIGQVVGEVRNQAGTSVGNYSFDRAAPAISSDVNVSGYVYLDANINGKRDSGESGLVSTASYSELWAKLVPVGASVAEKAAKVTGPDGQYLFEIVALGDYEIVINEDDDLNNVDPVDLLVEGYTGTEMSGLVRPVTVGNTSLYDQNFGLYRGYRVSGTVFQDTGDGGGVANDGIQNGTEKGIAGVKVRALDENDNLLSSATTDPNGKYALYVPADLDNIRIVESNLTGYLSTGATVVDPSNEVYDRGTDTVTVATVTSPLEGIDFGDVPKSTFTLDGSKTVLPGSSVQFPHVFTAGTDGEVTFSVEGPDASPYLWTYDIYHDLNGNGKLDEGEPLLSNPTAPAFEVEAGEEVHIIVRVFSPATVINGMDYTVQVNASFVLDTATPTITEELERSDKAIVNDQDKLTLIKEVDRSDANRGDTLIYTITYRNDTDKPITDLVISDSVPAYTDFVSADYGTPLPPEVTSITVTGPTAPGETAIKWTFAGALEPGDEGTVEFTVKVQ